MEKNKFIDITISKNGLPLASKTRGIVWLTISKKGLVYLSWKEGRLYFWLRDVGINTTVSSLQKNAVSKSVSFRWDGEWEDWQTGGTTTVHDLYEIKFNDADYRKIDKLL